MKPIKNISKSLKDMYPIGCFVKNEYTLDTYEVHEVIAYGGCSGSIRSDPTYLHSLSSCSRCCTGGEHLILGGIYGGVCPGRLDERGIEHYKWIVVAYQKGER